MTPRTLGRRASELERRCRERGLPLTVQRRVIFESLVQREDHPSADQLLGAVEQRLLGASRATVYRTLEALVDIGVVSKACHPSAVARHAGRTEPHHHLVCRCRGRMLGVEDERLGAIELPSTDIAGFEVTDFRVQLRRNCRDCQGRPPSRAVQERRKEERTESAP